MHTTSQIRVQVVQPVVPHYRLSFFRGISERGELDLRLVASPHIADSPDSVYCDDLPMDVSRPCRSFLGGRLFWQQGLTLDDSMQRGDVLVVDGNPRFASTWPLLGAARRKGVATIWWGHGWSATSRRMRASLRLRLMRLADIVLLYTDVERVALLERGFDSSRVFALNNALDQSAIRAAIAKWPPERLAEFTRAESLQNRSVLLFCGRLRSRPATDLDIALMALRRVTSRDPRHLLVVIGDGPDAARLRELARDFDVEAHVRWLGAIYDEEAIAPWFLTARCFVYPGAIGMSLLQAFGYGLPVITHGNRSEHGPEIAAFTEGANGLMYARRDPDSLAHSIGRIGRDEGLRRRLAAGAAETVRTRYSFESMLDRFHVAVAAASRRRAA